MFFLELICVLLSLKLCTAVTISDEDYKLLPQIYDMDDYLTCHSENNVYCKIKVALLPKDKNNKLWRIIMDTKKDKRYMERDIIYRARCVPREYFPNTEKVLTYITELETRELENVSLRAKVDHIKCDNDAQKLSAMDYLILSLLLGYLVAVIFATMVDMLSRTKYLKMDLSNHRIVNVLSVFSSWESLRKPVANANYNRLMCFQGFRTFNVCVVMASHVGLLYASMYITNTRIIEELYASAIGWSVVTITPQMVQANFVMSGWLLTIQVYSAAEKSDNKKLLLKVILEKTISRYLWFVLHIAFYIALNYLLNLFITGPQKDYFEIEHKACRTHWWGNLLLINNFFYFENMCNGGSWYLSCDFQAHVMCMVLFYLMYKLNFGIKFFGIIMLLVGITNSYMLYNAYEFYDMETTVSCPINPEMAKLENFIKNDSIFFLHTSFFQNFNSYLVGVLFGSVYYRHRNTTIKVTKVITVMWFVGFCGLPGLVMVLSRYSYPPLMSAIIASLLKPLFSLGIAIGMLGMSHNIGGFAKRMFEARSLEFISRWTFSTYLFHILLLYYNISIWTSMPEGSYTLLITACFTNIILAFVMGLTLHLIIERPLLKVLSMILPKLMYKQKTK